MKYLGRLRIDPLNNSIPIEYLSKFLFFKFREISNAFDFHQKLF